uniref:Putative terminase n=1 Tax=viral metagenome TaxID=1070528 RepID=A0A6M3XVB9_9ZZZZ
MIKNDPEIQDTIARCYASTRTTAKVIFPDIFYSEFSRLHDQIFEKIDAPSQKKAIAAPRGLGKTSIAQTVAMKGILFRDVNFVVYVSNSATMAEMQTENIKRELMTNRIVRELFGSIKISDHEAAGLDESFSKMAWVAFGSTLILPRGSDQQIRGLLWSGKRPDLFIFDDLEKKDELMNEEIRKKIKSWFYSDAMKAISRYDRKWKMIYIDTLKHEDSLLQELVDSDDWDSLVLAACDGNYKSLAPSYMTDEEIAAEVILHRKNGQLDVFYMEYMNMPVATEDATFKKEYFKYYEETDSEFLKQLNKLENITIVDPAKSMKVQANETCVLTVGVNLETSRVYVRDIVSRKMYPDQIYDNIFEQITRFKSNVLAIEVTSLNEFIKQPLMNEIIRRRARIGEPIWLNPRAKKEFRVGQLAPYYRQGYVYHNQSCCGGLEAQLMSFPRSKLWDIMDALAYFIEVLELGNRYFEPPPSDEYEDPEAEFRDLEGEYDPPIENWRYA